MDIVVVDCVVVVSVKYFDLVFFFVVVLDLSSAFRFLFPLVVDDTAAADGTDADDISTKQSIFIFPSQSNNTPSFSKSRRFFCTFNDSSPIVCPNPPIVRSDATTRCHGTLSHGPHGLLPIAVPTARADVCNSFAIDPYERTFPLGI